MSGQRRSRGETKRTKVSPEEGQTDASTTTSSRPICSSSSGDAARTRSPREDIGSSRVDNKRKADGERPEDPEREDGKWMRTEGNTRKTVEDEDESMLRDSVRYLKTLERTGAKKEADETQKEEDRRRETQFEKEGGDLDQEHVGLGREEEMSYMVKALGMF